MAINSSYLPNGSVQTQTDAPGVGLSANISPSYGGGGFPQIPTLNPGYVNFMALRKQQAQDEDEARKRQMYSMQLRAMQSEQGKELEQPTKFDSPWYSIQGAATRPVGLGPQQIPGMQADPRLLPPSMRPSQSVASYAPSAQFNQQLQADDEQQFGRQVNQDRARTSTAEDPYRKLAQQQQNALYGR
jgi:hypothetical protein